MTHFRIAALALSGLLLAGTAAQAQGWAETHQRRAEVNGRLARQNQRITQGVRDGQITPGQAAGLRATDSTVRTEERLDASVNGGHITPGERAGLNAQENANSRAIYNTRH